MVPRLVEERGVLNLSMAGLDPERKGAVATSKMAAKHNVEILEPLLFPVDADAG